MLGPERDEHLAVACGRAERAGDVRVGVSSICHGGAVLRALAVDRLGCPVVGDRRGHQEHIGIRAGERLRSRSAAVGVTTTSMPAGGRDAEVGGE